MSSRSGYSDDYETDYPAEFWQQAVQNAIRGKRGQKFLRDLAAALDAMPDKGLIADDLEADGEVCALGALGRARGVDLSKLDTENWAELGKTFGIATCLAQEIMYRNDDDFAYWEKSTITPEKRWRRVRDWVASQIVGERK